MLLEMTPAQGAAFPAGVRGDPYNADDLAGTLDGVDAGSKATGTTYASLGRTLLGGYGSDRATFEPGSSCRLHFME
jgi:hypothetical protein